MMKNDALREIIVIREAAKNGVCYVNETNVAALDVAIEAIQLLEDEWETKTFRNGWYEGFGMGKQELAHSVLKLFEEFGV